MLLFVAGRVPVLLLREGGGRRSEGRHRRSIRMQIDPSLLTSHFQLQADLCWAGLKRPSSEKGHHIDHEHHGALWRLRRCLGIWRPSLLLLQQRDAHCPFEMPYFGPPFWLHLWIRFLFAARLVLFFVSFFFLSFSSFFFSFSFFCCCCFSFCLFFFFVCPLLLNFRFSTALLSHFALMSLGLLFLTLPLECLRVLSASSA